MSATPVTGQAWTYHAQLLSYASPGAAQANPTLANGDVKLYRNGAYVGNLATLPTLVSGGNSTELLVTVTAGEMAGATVFTVEFLDQAGQEWGYWADTFFCDSLALDTTLGALNDLSAADVAAALLTAVVEGALTVQDALKLANAANRGKTDGMSPAGGTVHVRNPDDTLNRITATVDANGNRTAVTVNLT